MESVGRLNAIKFAALPCAIGWIMIATANGMLQLLGGRILTGLGAAIGTSPAIVYITEVARPDLRGSLISLAPTLASLGELLNLNLNLFMNEAFKCKVNGCISFQEWLSRMQRVHLWHGEQLHG